MSLKEDRQELIQCMVDRLVSEYEPERIILFGSYAYGDPDLDSDIDLLIVKQTSERFIDRMVGVRRILRGLHKGIPVDTLVVTPDELQHRLKIGDHFYEDIVSLGTQLYAA